MVPSAGLAYTSDDPKDVSGKDDIIAGSHPNDATTSRLESGEGPQRHVAISTSNAELHLVQGLSLRSASAQSRMSAVCGDTSEDELLRIVSTAIASQHPDGSWGSDDYPIMKSCFTAQVLEALHHAGMILVPDPASDPARSTVQTPIRRAIAWLRANQQSDGSWGEDTWDTCQVVKALWKSGYRENDPVIEKGIGFLRQAVDNKWPNKGTYWFGPGFMGAALEVFNAV